MRTALSAFILLTLTACAPPATEVLYGYAEGDFLMLAPETSGRVETVRVTDGQRVTAGEPLLALESEAERLALEAARQQAEAAEARLADASTGGRAPEVEAARDRLSQARAEQVRARDALNRAQRLFDQGFAPRARLDEAEAAAATANARVAELSEALTLAEMPARDGQLQALAATARAAQADAARLEESLARRTVRAPADGRVERVLAREGELAGPGAPGLRFLPDGAVHAVLFLPEEQIGAYQIGDAFAVECDGCPDTMTARLSVIDAEAEFTPPIIYSDQERSRLVFRAEARFDGATPPPGAPLRLALRSGTG